jgi:hypothetical protein
MPVTRRIEWNGNNNILVLEDGDARIDMTLDDFLAMAEDLKAGLLLADPVEPQRRPQQRLR